MLYRELPAIASAPSTGWVRWLAPLLVAAAGLTLATLLWLAGFALLAVGGAFAGAVAAALLALRDRPAPLSTAISPGPDFALVGAILAMHDEPVAITNGEGSLLVANEAYRERFGAGRLPLGLGADEAATEGLKLAQSMAWRDGAGCVAGIDTLAGRTPVEVDRVGARNDLLLWRFPRPSAVAAPAANAAPDHSSLDELDSAGIMAAQLDADGRTVAANRSFFERLHGHDWRGRGLDELLSTDSEGLVRLVVDGKDGRAYRPLRLPAAGGELVMLADIDGLSPTARESSLQALLDVLPVGLALVDRDGRFLTMNEAFRKAAGIKGKTVPSYPGDIVAKEDKAAVADAVRRNARGPAMSGDIAVRLAAQPGEPVALTIAGLRGLGEAVVLLLLKDNREEAKLKRQIAQATKMQVVGQLAGGVAHDFNNILTAIIGHCDLMLLRHTPGDSDYDDIQQIKSNSNRAAGLTRQLLAFSRQQTLRPQVLQLPDVVSEVSHLLKRLLGETVELEVKHGRQIGPVRADPGQLEQVIINLAVNARDAMAAKGGGTLTIQTYPIRADQVAELGSDILPVDDYSALSVTDTGCGIAPSVLSKIFEPFFTTKEVGKGTGLGLSTVYGIVKQSGGYIFADSKLGEGARFVIYLPVYREEESAAKAEVAAPEPKDALWGSGTVLLVEDEPTVRNVAERALTRHGYTVVTADNGEEALEALERMDEIDLLISDVVMPGMDGPTVVREARKSRPDLKILFMSGYAEEQLRKSIDLENVNFLPKPFSVTELAEAARRAIGAK
jgi:two-component system, cell cycle sensor histidine kinase and response regulator CckA